jgi:hypothetical protein
LLRKSKAEMLQSRDPFCLPRRAMMLLAGYHSRGRLIRIEFRNSKLKRDLYG